MKKVALVLSLVALAIPVMALASVSAAQTSSSSVQTTFTLNSTVLTWSDGGSIDFGAIGWGSGTNNPDPNKDIVFSAATGWGSLAPAALFSSSTVGRLHWRANVPVTISAKSSGFEKWNGTAWVALGKTGEDSDNAWYLSQFLKYDIALEGLYWGKNVGDDDLGQRKLIVSKGVAVGGDLSSFGSVLDADVTTPSFYERDLRGGTLYVVPHFQVPTDKEWDQVKKSDFVANAGLNWKAIGGSTDTGTFPFGFIGADAGTYRDAVTLTVVAL